MSLRVLPLQLVLVLVLVLMLMLVLVLVLLLLMLPLVLPLVLPFLLLLIFGVRVHYLVSNRQNFIDGQHTWGWLTKPQTMEGLFPFFGQVLATASCEQTDDNGNQAEDKREADDQTAEQSLVT